MQVAVVRSLLTATVKRRLEFDGDTSISNVSVVGERVGEEGCSRDAIQKQACWWNR